MHREKLIIALLVLFTITGCASVSLVESRKLQPVPAKGYRDFLVVGISQNRQMRQVFEEVLSGELRKKGLTATPSYTVASLEEQLSRPLIEKVVQTIKVDAVLASRLVDQRRKTHTDVGYVMTGKGVDSYTSIYGGGSVTYATFDSKPVEITTSTTYALETDLFDTATQNLVWTGVTNAVDPQGIITASKQIAGVIINRMSKEGLIP